MNITQAAYEICSVLEQNEFIAYFAGGYVRDRLLEIPSTDIDIATDALPSEIAAIFPDHILVGAQFGVVIVKYLGFQFEVATFRSDLEYESGRRPKGVILKSTPLEDAKRRDFTINGLFLDPKTDTIIDFVGGQKDIEKKIVRTIGNPEERFGEDRLRMIRAIRFQNRYSFTLDDATKTCIAKMSHELLPAVSMERIYLEINKMREYGNLSAALLLMHEVGLLQTIFPQIKSITGEELAKRLAGLHPLPKGLPAIVVVIHALGEEKDPEAVVDYLKGSSEDKKWVIAYLETKKMLERASITPYEWASLFADERRRKVLELITLQRDPKWRESWRQQETKLAPFIERMKARNPLIHSKDLMLLGIKPGIRMGKLLQQAEQLSVNEHILQKETLLGKLKDLYEDDFKHS